MVCVCVCVCVLLFVVSVLQLYPVEVAISWFPLTPPQCPHGEDGIRSPGATERCSVGVCACVRCFSEKKE